MDLIPDLPFRPAWLLAAAFAVAPMIAAAESPAFDFAVLRERAATLARTPYVEPKVDVPRVLRELNYDQVQGLRFDPAQTIWAQDGLPFRLRFFHLGGLFQQPVAIHEWRDGGTTEFAFSPRLFRYPEGVEAATIPPQLGFAGLQMLADGDLPGGELGAFLGASYFRLVCFGSHYGLSARGLALDSGGEGPEEFPRFREFWVRRPDAGGDTLVVLALLDSPSVTGAYRFEFSPGDTTLTRVRAEVFARVTVPVLGIAPLTSMFLHGESPRVGLPDFRAEVHDSDGFLLHGAGGEWLWRPLTNPSKVRLVTFGGASPRGFGLLQRDRDYGRYEDLDACYHQRPGAWVEPVGDWGDGEVRLLELPSNNEFADNIVAFWHPREPLRAGQSVAFEYYIRWSLAEPAGGPLGRAVSTKVGSVGDGSGYLRCVVEFDGPELQALGAGDDVQPQITIGANARAGHRLVTKNRFNGAWRVVFDFKPDDPARDVELRCFLQRGPAALTETWSYLWSR